MRTARGLVVTLLVLLMPAVAVSTGAAAPEGQMTWGVHISLAPTWFDPAETSGVITPFMVLYGLHDALVKPMPGNLMTPSLAESWAMSSDGLVYEFVLRKGVRFHNGDPVTAEDVKFSFERYRGASSKLLKDSVEAIETPDPGRVRIRLRRPWPDFVGPRVEEPGIGVIPGYAFSAPYEDVKPSPTMSASDGVGIPAVQVGSRTSSRLPEGSRKYSSRPVNKPWARYVSSSIFTPRSWKSRTAFSHSRGERVKE
jgi:ABC-type transport system substrate-binding protein